jgi:hypothetical protein
MATMVVDLLRKRPLLAVASLYAADLRPVPAPDAFATALAMATAALLWTRRRSCSLPVLSTSPATPRKKM